MSVADQPRGEALEEALIDAALLRRWPLPAPASTGDKEARGRVLIMGGAQQMPGPVILAANAALRVGAGKLQIATVRSLAPWVATAVPEAYVHGLAEARGGGFAAQVRGALLAAAQSSPSIVLGPGVIESPALKRIVIELLLALGEQHTVVLDAGALTSLAGDHARLRTRKARLIITPHAGEMATLLDRSKDDILNNPREAARAAAAAWGGAVVVLKGAVTFITEGRRLLRNETGNVGLATSGSGDVLAGIIAGCAARGAAPLQAAAWGVHLHACAGDELARKVAPIGYLARELLTELPRLMNNLGPESASTAPHRG